MREGDILIVHTGYHKHAWDRPDVQNRDMPRAGIENKEFGYYVRHPGPSPGFFEWAIDMKLKIRVLGVDCGCAEHPMNTNIRLHASRPSSRRPRRQSAARAYGKVVGRALSTRADY